MRVDWRELLDRVLDGEKLSEAEAHALAQAFEDGATRGEVREWLSFDARLHGQLAPRAGRDVALSRERLLAKAALREKSRQVKRGPARRRAARWWLAAAAAAALLAAAGVWLAVRDRYPRPEVAGDFRIVSEAATGGLHRGDRLVAGQGGARLSLGGYCDVALSPQTEVVVRGERGREAVDIDRGRIVSRVTPDKGEFRVVTPLGSIKVVGTEFVTTVEPQQGGMTVNRVHGLKKAAAVTVMVISGSVAYQFGEMAGILHAGMSQAFAGGEGERATLPAELKGFKGILVGTITSEVAREFMLKIDKIATVWPQSTAKEPQEAVGKTIGIVVGKNRMLEQHLRTLKTLRRGDQIIVEAFDVQGFRLTVMELFRKAGGAEPEGEGARREGEGDRPAKREGDGEGDRPVKRERDGEGDRPVKRERDGEGDRPVKREGDGEGDRPVKREGIGEGDRPVKRERDGEGDRPVKREGIGEGDRPVKREGGDGWKERPVKREGGDGDRPVKREGGDGDRPVKREGVGEGDRPVKREGGDGDRPAVRERDGEGDRPVKREGGDAEGEVRERKPETRAEGLRELEGVLYVYPAEQRPEHLIAELKVKERTEDGERVVEYGIWDTEQGRKLAAEGTGRRVRLAGVMESPRDGGDKVIVVKKFSVLDSTREEPKRREGDGEGERREKVEPRRDGEEGREREERKPEARTEPRASYASTADVEGFRGMLEGTIAAKGQDAFVLRVEKVSKLWQSSAAKRPENMVGKTVTIAIPQGDNERFTKALAELKVGDKVLVAATHLAGNRLSLAELLRKAEF